MATLTPVDNTEGKLVPVEDDEPDHASLVSRLVQGMSSIASKTAEGFGDQPLGMGPESLSFFENNSALKAVHLEQSVKHLVNTPLMALDLAARSFSAFSYGAGETAKQAALAVGSSQGGAEDVGRDTTNLVNFLGI